MTNKFCGDDCLNCAMFRECYPEEDKKKGGTNHGNDNRLLDVCSFRIGWVDSGIGLKLKGGIMEEVFKEGDPNRIDSIDTLWKRLIEVRDCMDNIEKRALSNIEYAGIKIKEELDEAEDLWGPIDEFVKRMALEEENEP